MQNIDVMSQSLRINLGCGQNPYTGFVNLDKIAAPGVDKIWDLETTPLPFEDNSADEIWAEHVLEHIINFMPLMEEIHRIAKPDAILFLKNIQNSRNIFNSIKNNSTILEITLLITIHSYFPWKTR